MSEPRICLIRKVVCFFIYFCIAGESAAADKGPDTVLIRTTRYDSVIIDLGSLQQFVSNNTKSFSNNEDPKTFRIGRDDLLYPSMNWVDGNYAINNYLSSGLFAIGHDSNTVLFDRGTSSDFTVRRNAPGWSAPYAVSFSMTDDSAGINRKGIRTICRIYGWTETWRDDFLIYEYVVQNTGAVQLRDFYAALFLDFDISSAGQLAPGGNYWSDDRGGFAVYTELNQIPVSLSYMYDADDPTVAGDDRGGYLTPAESKGYAGSRILDSPPTKKGVPANTPSGQRWYTGRNRPRNGGQFFRDMQAARFDATPQENADYRYMQVLGPWDLAAGDSLRLVFAIGIGDGVFGMQENLKTAYNLYWSVFRAASLPQIVGEMPTGFFLTVYSGENLDFSVQAEDADNDSLIYIWRVDQKLAADGDSVFTYYSDQYGEGNHTVLLEISDGKASAFREWIVNQQPPRKFYLGQNYPNPFNGKTTIPFELNEAGEVTITIYDINGRKVITLIHEELKAGRWLAEWDGLNINRKQAASGIYFYQITSSHYKEAKQMLYLK